MELDELQALTADDAVRDRSSLVLHIILLHPADYKRLTGKDPEAALAAYADVMNIDYEEDVRLVTDRSLWLES